MAVGVILLLSDGKFSNRFRLSLAVGLTIPPSSPGLVLMLGSPDRAQHSILPFRDPWRSRAVANAIPLVLSLSAAGSRAREPLEGREKGARSRLRPILMTSFRMLPGMVRWRWSRGSGDQSEPLGRAGSAVCLGATLRPPLIQILPGDLGPLQSRHAGFPRRSKS